MEFMLQPGEVMLPSHDPPAAAKVVEEEVAGIDIGSSGHHNNPEVPPTAQLPPPTPQYPPEQPIYFSDGVMYPSELNQQPTASNDGQASTNEELAVALPNNLLEVCGR